MFESLRTHNGCNRPRQLASPLATDRASAARCSPTWRSGRPETPCTPAVRGHRSNHRPASKTQSPQQTDCRNKPYHNATMSQQTVPQCDDVAANCTTMRQSRNKLYHNASTTRQTVPQCDNVTKSQQTVPHCDNVAGVGSSVIDTALDGRLSEHINERFFQYDHCRWYPKHIE